MIALSSLMRVSIGTIAFSVILLDLSACGPKVTFGDENSVLVKAGPFTSFSDAKDSAQKYCSQYGKHADVEGSDPNPDKLQDTYRFNCVADPQ